MSGSFIKKKIGRTEIKWCKSRNCLHGYLRSVLKKLTKNQMFGPNRDKIVTNLKTSIEVNRLPRNLYRSPVALEATIT